MTEEERRIAELYAGYDRNEKVQARWNQGSPGNAAILKERNIWFEEAISGRGGLSGKKMLDLGCGNGGFVESLISLGARRDDIYGVDVAFERLLKAKRSYDDVHFLEAEGTRLPFKSEAFDVIALLTVLSSVSDQGVRSLIAREASRVLTKDGFIIWYDIRVLNPVNSATRAVSRRSLRQLFPGFSIDVRSLTVVPPLARAAARVGSWTYSAMSKVPWLHSHNVGLLTKSTMPLSEIKSDD